MSHLLRRRRLVAVPILAVALSGQALTGGPAAAAADGPGDTDPRPARTGADWLAGQLTDGVLHNDQYGFDDYGLTIDAALALDAVGGQAAAVAAITDAVAAGLDGYTTGGAPGEVYAGSVAKTLVLATSQGRDPSSYGGADLVAMLESTVQTDTPLLGRIKDTSAWGDYANVIGQAFAARGLDAAGSDLADEVTAFLLDQQCAPGYFRLSFAPEDAADQTCGPTANADPDTTALAVLALLGQRGEAAVDEAIAAASAWLRAQQRRNGSLGGGTDTEAANTNSTGLAGWVFAETGRNRAAAKAAGWVRARQADETPACGTRLLGATGAIGYDDAGVVSGRAEGITEATADQWRRATSQALPALASAPAGGTASLSAPTGYVKGGRRVRITLRDIAPGSSVCLQRGGFASAGTAGRGGDATGRLRLPRKTSTVSVTGRDANGVLARASVDVLGKQELGVRPVRGTVGRGDRQTVRVSGLAPAEQVLVRYRGAVVARTVAGARGNARATFRVGRRAGEFTVTALGEFRAIRRGAAEFRVR